jgi:hypothetical protein
VQQSPHVCDGISCFAKFNVQVRKKNYFITHFWCSDIFSNISSSFSSINNTCPLGASLAEHYNISWLSIASNASFSPSFALNKIFAAVES